MSDPHDPCGGEFAARQVFYTPDGKLMAAGERPRLAPAVPLGEPPASSLDRPLHDVGPRPCSCCGRIFQPTIKRRRLCADCFQRACEGDPFEPHGEGDPNLP